MDREDILKAVQDETPELGEYEITVERRAMLYSAGIALILCAILMLVEMFAEKRLDYGKPAMIFAIYSISDLYEGMKLSNKKKKIKGVVEAIFTVLFLLLFVGALLVWIHIYN